MRKVGEVIGAIEGSWKHLLYGCGKIVGLFVSLGVLYLFSFEVKSF